MLTAAIQFKPEWPPSGFVHSNTRALCALIIEAAKAGAKLCCAPELCLVGYSFMSETEARPFAEVLTQPKPGSAMAIMTALAAKLDIAIAWGLIEEDPGTGKLYNAQVLMLPSGDWIGARKTNFFANDHLWATPGTASPPIVEYMGKKIGLLICADIRDKTDKLDELYEPGDCDVVAFSSNWGKGGYPSGRWVKFAKENKVFLVAANRFGTEENNDFGAGGICVIEPCGKVHCEGLKWNQSCIVYAEVP